MSSKADPRDPLWLTLARKDLGVSELKGPKTNSTIKKWLTDLEAWWSDDETPWCGVALAHWMASAGQTYPKAYYRAREWETWGKSIAEPLFGCVAVFSRQGGGHVGLVTGMDSAGRLKIYGGNQGDCVCEIWIDRSRATAFRVPTNWNPGPENTLKVEQFVATAESSTNEA